MEVIIPLGEVFFAGLIQASLQLELGGLLLLYHASSGKHIRQKTKYLVDNYIFGVVMLVFLSLAAVCFVLGTYFEGQLYPQELIVVAALLIVIALAVWTFYYRRGRSTELWLPRTVARYIDTRAKSTNSNTEAFSLGVLTTLAEFPFSLTLYLVAGNSILGLQPLIQLLAVILYTAIAILPAVILRLAVRRGQTVVEVQRWRVQHKKFFRIMSGCGFLVLGLFIFAFEVI